MFAGFLRRNLAGLGRFLRGAEGAGAEMRGVAEPS